MDPTVPTLDLIKEAVPDVKKIGMVYNPAEANSANLVEAAAVEKQGVTLPQSLVDRADKVLA